jgi:5-methylcytosine-specific restriction protein B
MPDLPLSEFAATFDRAALQPKLAEAEQQRRMILEKFPRESLANLEIKDYADDRDDRGTLSWLLAGGSQALGKIRGVAFNAVGIHRLRGSGLYRSSFKDTEDAEKDWIKLREGLVKCCELVESGQWAAINKVPYALNIPSVRTKLLFVYFPDQVLPVYGSTEVAHFMEALGVPAEEGEGKWSAVHNRRLLEYLRSLPELQGWTTLEMVMLLRAWNPMEISREPRVFKVAPGEDAVFWDQCLAQGMIILGWGKTGDLSGARSRGDVRSAMEPAGYYEDKATLTRKVREVWEFVSVKVGDIIVANKGTSQILAVGTVVEPGYEYLSLPLDGSDDFQHAVHVEWDTSKAMTIPAQKEWAFATVKELTGELKRLVLSGPSAISHSNPNSPPMPALNRILYGPPGTGKTHRVIREAAAICGRGMLTDGEAKAVYDKVSAEGRVRLVTFHQSFGYEDFIEGIRPMMDEGGAARFEVRDGVFKEIAMEALFACLEPLMEHTGNTPHLEVPRRPGKGTKTGRVWEIADEAIAQTSSGSVRDAVLREALSENINANTATTQYSRWQKARRIANLSVNPASILNKDAPDPSDQDVVRAYLSDGVESGWQLRADKNYPPYVLVIDEINRGNISRIFGELITLIEDDKRHGASNALQVMLPSSREPFTVPPNLFLLGTMNTADKSLALLDVALRRRFEFEELAPDFEVCGGLSSEMKAVLTRINERIELRKDRDHRIGHAFFMGMNDEAGFNHAFRRKVVPLLQEYFFNDIDGARFVLGEESRKDGGGFLRPLLASVETRLQRNRWRWFTDEQPGMDCWQQLQINFGSADS